MPSLSLMTRKVTRRSRQTGARFEYLFMRPDGEQLARIAALLDEGKLRPIIDRTFPLAETKAALAYSEAGRATGKIVVTVKS